MGRGKGVQSTKYLEIWGWEFSWTQIFIAVKDLHISSVAKLGHLVGSYIAPLVMLHEVFDPIQNLFLLLQHCLLFYGGCWCCDGVLPGFSIHFQQFVFGMERNRPTLNCRDT
jgi:hypothetical protein